MGEFFRGIMSLPTPFNMVVVIVLIGCVTGVLTTIAKELRKYACHRQDLDLKRELVERGLPADEIERILAAKGPMSKGG